ncbi:MAG: type II toxin-antitoxin system HicA family toxin [Hyphomicrobiales bacterium]|nr:type II toxin-antitoxin system HicA family toxin [Hyphomicrobiales bacterium]
MKRRDLVRHLFDQGCVLVREGGRHSWWGNPRISARSSVSRHTEIAEQLVRKICKDLGIEPPRR